MLRKRFGCSRSGGSGWPSAWSEPVGIVPSPCGGEAEGDFCQWAEELRDVLCGNGLQRARAARWSSATWSAFERWLVSFGGWQALFPW